MHGRCHVGFKESALQISGVPRRLQRIRVKIEDTSSLSMRQHTSEDSMHFLRGLSTANVTESAVKPEMVGLHTHACCPADSHSQNE